VAAGVVLTGQVKRILEIGTERGEFTAFLHSLSHDLEITTVDLPGDDVRYINATTQTSSDLMSTDEAVASTINQRRKNIGDLKNVRFWEMSSVRLSLLDDQFDLIYVDGDHTFPIVAIDAINAFRLVAPDGWILFDDLISDRRAKSEYGGSESTQIVNVMEKSGILTVTRFHKRLEAAKLIDETDRKHIALARPRKRVV
jgi:predicted O-methyltransferase YrrM